ncbi:MAG: tetratricopeptide repeat protein [Thermoplasmata archaeon]|nr:tetratricopeptide repeat protein [Thermoplasmata archaeon]
MARIVVSQNERLLLHLLENDRHRDEAEVPLAVSQEGIATRLGTQVHNASRALSSLQGDGLVSDRLAHVRGAPKRRRAYFLTEKGRRAAESVRSDLGRRRIVLEADGRAQELSLEDALRKAITSAGNPVGFLDLVEAAREDDIVRVESFKKAPPTVERAVEFAQRAHGKPKLEAFFGRAAERRDISGAMTERDTAAVLLWGIPGIGKSYLASKVFDESVGKRPVFWYTLREWDTESSFLTALSGFLAMLGRGATQDAVGRGHGAADLFAPFVTDLSDSGTVVFIDDAHKAAPPVALLLSILVDAARASGSAKVVLVSRAVPGFFSNAGGGNLTIELSGLDHDSARQMAESVHAADAAAAVEQSHGHPLLIRLMSKVGAGKAKGDAISFIEREVYSAASPDERGVLELLSIFRHPVKLEAIPGIDYAVVAGLRQKALVTEQENGIYTHDLLREFFSNRMTKEAKVAQHAKAASYCEGNSGVEWALETLYHFIEAGDWASAKRIASSHATDLADDFPGETLALVSRIPPGSLPGRDRADLLFIRGQLEEGLGLHAEAVKDYEESASLLASQGDSTVRAEVLEALAKLQSVVEQWTESFAAHEKALKLYQQAGDKDGQSREWMNIGGAHRRRGDHVKAREAYSTALSLAAMEENRSSQAACLNNIGLLDWDEGRLRDAELHLKESVKLAHAVKDHAGEAKGLENLAELYRAQFKLTEMTTLLWESSEAFRRAGEVDEFKRLQAACAEALGAQGRTADGIDLCRKALDRPELRPRKGLFQKGPRFDSGDVALVLALVDLLRRSGDYKEATRQAARLSGMADLKGDATLKARAWMELAMVQEDSDDFDSALSSLEEAREVLRGLGDHGGLAAVHIRRGTILEKRGDEAGAVKEYEEAARHAEIADDQTALRIAEENIEGLKG